MKDISKYKTIVLLYLCIQCLDTGICSNNSDLPTHTNNTLYWDYRKPSTSPIILICPAIELNNNDEYEWEFSLKTNINNNEKISIISECSCFSACVYPHSNKNPFDWKIVIKKHGLANGDIISKFFLRDQSNHIKLIEMKIFVLPRNGYIVDFNKIYTKLSNSTAKENCVRLYGAQKTLNQINISSPDQNIICNLSKTVFYDKIKKIFFKEVSIETKNMENRFYSIYINNMNDIKSFNVFIPLL